MKKTLCVSVCLLLLVGCSDNTKEADFVPQTAQEKEMLSGCIGGTQQGAKPLSKSDGNKFCLCLVAGIREKYSIKQLQALDNAKDSERRIFDQHVDKLTLDCKEKLKAS